MYSPELNRFEADSQQENVRTFIASEKTFIGSTDTSRSALTAKPWADSESPRSAHEGQRASDGLTNLGNDRDPAVLADGSGPL